MLDKIAAAILRRRRRAARPKQPDHFGEAMLSLFRTVPAPERVAEPVTVAAGTPRWVRRAIGADAS